MPGGLAPFESSGGNAAAATRRVDREASRAARTLIELFK